MSSPRKRGPIASESGSLHVCATSKARPSWVPAFAGMTRTKGPINCLIRAQSQKQREPSMRTVQPSIMVGAYAWDQDRLPRDEFQIRVAALNRVMDEGGLAAVLIYGDAAEHSALAYFSNFIPRLRWGMALFSRT